MIETITGWIQSFFTSMLEWAVNQFVDFIVWLLPFCVDTGFLVVEKLMALVQLPGTMTTALGAWSGLPPQVVYLLNGIGLPTAVAMFVGAVTVRASLNFLPSWLTRI
jgi:hypothetical protein